MARSEKHDFNFKYTRHSKLFADPTSTLNQQAAGSYMRSLKKAGLTQVFSRKWQAYDKATGRHVDAFTVWWYTRKKLGAKKAVTA